MTGVQTCALPISTFETDELSSQTFWLYESVSTSPGGGAPIPLPVLAALLALEGTPPKAAKKSEPKEAPKDDGDEPVVREEKKAPAVTPKQKLAATVTDWDTDD